MRIYSSILIKGLILHSQLLVQSLMKAVWAVPVLIALGSPLAYGADIYRWTDENWQVHFSDTAPRELKKSATRIDTRQYELSPAQRKEAEARAARDKEKARSVEASGRKTAEVAASPPSDSKARAEADKANAPATDCATLLRRFQESSECYAPFFNANGSTKPNASETCGPAVPYPARECS